MASNTVVDLDFAVHNFNNKFWEETSSPRCAPVDTKNRERGHRLVHSSSPPSRSDSTRSATPRESLRLRSPERQNVSQLKRSESRATHRRTRSWVSAWSVKKGVGHLDSLDGILDSEPTENREHDKPTRHRKWTWFGGRSKAEAIAAYPAEENEDGWKPELQSKEAPGPPSSVALSDTKGRRAKYIPWLFSSRSADARYSPNNTLECTSDTETLDTTRQRDASVEAQLPRETSSPSNQVHQHASQEEPESKEEKQERKLRHRRGNSKSIMDFLRFKASDHTAGDAIEETAKLPVKKVEGSQPAKTSTLSCFSAPQVEDDAPVETVFIQGLTGGTAGIRNLGNTCFINAAMQCLRATPQLLDRLSPELLANPAALPEELFESRMVEKICDDGAGPAVTGCEQGAVAQLDPAVKAGLHESSSSVLQPLSRVSTTDATLHVHSAESDESNDRAGVISQSDTSHVSVLPPGVCQVPSTTATSVCSSQASPSNHEGDEGAKITISPAVSEVQDPLDAEKTLEECRDTCRSERPEDEGPDHPLQPCGGVNCTEADQKDDSAAVDPSDVVADDCKAEEAVDEVADVSTAEMAKDIVQVMARVATGNTDDIVLPRKLWSNMRLHSTGSVFADGGQHDSHEFLRYVMNVLHEAYDTVIEKPPYTPIEELPDELPHSKAQRLWKLQQAHESSAVSDIFQGQLESVVVCCKCQSTFHTYEPFMDISLSLNKGKGLTSLFKVKTVDKLEDCLRSFTEEEKLEGNEAFWCSACSARTSATKHLRIHKLPDVLVLQIKRFKVVNRQHVKLSSNLSIPLHGLDVAPFLSSTSDSTQDDAVYDLYALANHTGSLQSGHYTAHVKVTSGEEPDDQKWFLFTDDTAKEVSSHEVVSPEAYIMFYSRRKGRSPEDRAV